MPLKKIKPPTPKPDAPKAKPRKQRLALRGARGKPRRGKTVAKIRTIRSDDETYYGLMKEFGSIGNSLHFLYQGIADFREAYELEAPEGPTPIGRRLKRERFIDKAEIKLLILIVEEALREYLHGPEARPYNALLDKLHSALAQR